MLIRTLAGPRPAPVRPYRNVEWLELDKPSVAFDKLDLIWQLAILGGTILHKQDRRHGRLTYDCCRNKIVRDQQEPPLTMTEITLFPPGLSVIGGKTISATFDGGKAIVKWRRVDPARDRTGARSCRGAQPAHF
jgi:hypothetical protein